MATVYSKDTLERIRALLDGVQTVGQAQAVIRSTMSMAAAAVDDISQWIFETSWRKQAKADLSQKMAVLQVQAQSVMGGMPSADVGTLWPPLRQLCLDLWLYAILVSQEFPPDETTALERFNANFASNVDNLAFGLSQAPAGIVTAVTAITSTVGKAAEGALSGLLGPLKWYLLGAAGLLAVAGFVAYRKGLL